MRTAILAFMIAMFCAAASAIAAEVDSRQSLQDAQQFIDELNANIPNGWHARLDVAGDGRGLEIAIESNETLPVKYFSPNPPPGGPPVQNTVVALWLHCMPYMKPDEFAPAKTRNDELIERRLSFVRKNLAGIKFGYMGADPASPSAFSPATDAERVRVEQYAFEWLNTEPAKLPTHSHRLLSFIYVRPPLRIMDASRDAEFHKITDRIDRMLTPYEAQD
ncbi:hypothetical protein [Lacipirellula parvula]|uniref:Uncharacterized protein n=1 Tax=Lacipirellula parvula TaxID=2650471 RepID=A0A5K7XHW8_9BACT|nr:hypothetical protein [Lacipirellula parvula]BBO36494.1 hypothetical protein PLANPX_6106 [Lacipirellula parvula]